jgi:pimeloyl-ACP methyl ester carboxylesterase
MLGSCSASFWAESDQTGWSKTRIAPKFRILSAESGLCRNKTEGSQRLKKYGLAARASSALAVLSVLNQLTIPSRARRRAASSAPARRQEPVPILLVPGILGTSMVDPVHSNFPVWGDYRSSLFFRKKHDDLDLSILPGRENRLHPGEIVWKFTIAPGLIALPVYEDFRQSMLCSGYAMGSLGNPTSKKGFYALEYDWRRDIVASARAVARAVANLRRSLGVEKVHLVGHSWGCIISRYYIRYGDADVLADTPEPARPGAANIHTYFAVAPPFGGTLRAFQSLQYGYTPGVSLLRAVAPHHVSASPAAYQLMRHGGNLLVDESGQDLDLDLMDAGTLKMLKWGPYKPRSFEALLERARGNSPATTAEEMTAAIRTFLVNNLRRAKRLGEAMGQADAHDSEVRTVTYTTHNRPTLRKMVLCSRNGSHHLLATEKEIRKIAPKLIPAVTAPGDEHITFDDILKHTGHPAVIDNPREVPEGNYILTSDALSHRQLFNADPVLTNLLLNISCRK